MAFALRSGLRPTPQFLQVSWTCGRLQSTSEEWYLGSIFRALGTTLGLQWSALMDLNKAVTLVILLWLVEAGWTDLVRAAEYGTCKSNIVSELYRLYKLYQLYGLILRVVWGRQKEITCFLEGLQKRKSLPKPIVFVCFPCIPTTPLKY
jgi:hypothetical protein